MNAPTSDEPHPGSIEDAVEPLLAALAAPGGSAVVVAPPGSGKTTRLPLALLHAPWLGSRRIVVLEPRRLATRAAARRMAHLLGEQVGETVGFVTGDERNVSARTRIEVVTEGVLTRRLQRDPDLPGAALLIFDEIHERNLHTDIGLALALDVRREIRPDLRICAMSATVAADRFAALIGGAAGSAPIIVAGGEPFPVAVHWFPGKPGERLEPRVADTVRTAVRRGSGDALVFLPGVREITRTGELLGDLPTAGIDVLPLYGALPADEQDAALRPSGGGRRRVVLATDIAESSLTVDGVRLVVDSGLARAPRFDARTGMTRLETVSISRASAEQRAGRAGRQGPGVVYRMWSKGEHAVRRPYHEPEIQQVDLAGFALELAAWGISEPSALDFLDQPPAGRYAEARQLLTLLGALDDSGRITTAGRALNSLPLHPRLAAMVQARLEERSPRRAALACVIATLIEERDLLRGRPDEIPADIESRLTLIADRDRRHPAADGRSIGAARRRAAELIRRVGVDVDVEAASRPSQPGEAGELLATAFPDRLAVRRNQAGRFQLPSGTAVWVRPTDALAGEEYVVAVDLDGDRREARLRLGAPIDVVTMERVYGTQLNEASRLGWDERRDELVEIVERRLGSAILDTITRKPAAGPFVIDALVERVRQRGCRVALRWLPEAESMRARATFLHGILGDPWPDWSWERLDEEVETWLAPFLLFARSRADLEAIDPATALRATTSHQLLTDVDRLAPTHHVTARGRRFAIDYAAADPTVGSGPVLAVRVQELYGLRRHPTVADGRVPLLLHLLSPAGRPIQITADLPGFWAGSWADARKEMAGRYPKHFWPADPATARPPER